MRKLTIIFGILVLVIAAFAFPTFADNICNADINFKQVGREQLAAGQLDAALATIDCGLSFDNSNYDLWMMRAVVFCHTGNFDAAIENFTQAIEVRPDSTYAYNNRGWAHLRNGNVDAAMADLNYALELNPENPHAYNNRGLAYQTIGEYEAALADFEQAVAIGMVQPWAEINLYNIEFEMSKLNES